MVSTKTLKKMKRPTVRDQIYELVGAAYHEISLPAEASNVAAALYDIFFWQEVSSLAKDMLEKAWTSNVECGAVPDDDAMRAAGIGERIVAESKHFSCVATVQAPRSNFDRELFLKRLSKRYKLPVSALETLADDCKKPSTPPLRKRVVEA